MLTGLDSWLRLKDWGVEEWLRERQAAGHIGQAGFSFHGSQGEFFRLLDQRDWDFCQIQYNYSDENFQAGTAGLKKAAERMPVIIMEPLLGGRLAALPRKGLALFRQADPTKSAAAWGLNWVWDHGEAAVVLSGMSDTAQLEENLRLADAARPGMLSDEERALYPRVIEALNSACRVHCTGCNYCMPCPRGVNIPGCFSAYNLSYSMNWYFGARNYITSIAPFSGTPGGAGRCAACGQCEPRCPQRLPIITHLKAVRRRLEPFWLRWLLRLARAALKTPKSA
jgi:predicted aldo/keto reductase-like oxidoreductase